MRAGSPLLRITFGRAVLLIVAATLCIEGILAFRAWVQLSGMQVDAAVLRLLYSASTTLVSPFRGLETTTPIRQDAVLELATIVAVEAYLVLAVVAFGFVCAAKLAGSFVSFHMDREGVTVARRASQSV
jgi:hypothetical protein